MNFPTYLYRRLRLYWQVLFTLALGVVLAVTLLASGPVMVESVLDFALHHALDTSQPMDAHLRFVTTMDPDASTYQKLEGELSDVIYPRIEKYLDQVVPTGETQWLHPWLQDEVVKDQRVNFSFYGMDDSILLEHAEFTFGGWPEQVQPSENVIAAVIGPSMAEDYNLAVGDHLPLSFKSSAEQPDLWIEVRGILKPVDYDDPFWFGTYNPLRKDTDSRYLAQYSILVPNDSFFRVASSTFPASSVQIAWHAFLSPESVKVEDLPTLKGQLHALSADVEDLGLRVETGLAETIEGIVIRTTSVRVPLYLLITTVVLLALYYVLMVATLSLRQASREFAILLSRGASTWQLMGVKLVEAGSICGVALLSGPGLALLLMRGLIHFGPLAETGREYWTLQLPQAAWLAAIVGAVACLASVLGPLPGALRKSVVNYAQTLSRSGRTPWWQRFYLDVVLMLAGLILLWRLRIYGSILSQSGSGPQVDWLLLLAPLALLLGAATIMLRIFPLILQLMARLVGEGRGLSSALAFWQAARDPGHIARLVLLLTLAMALGSLSSGLNVALDRNETDRAYYATGGDLRLQMSSNDQRSQPQGSVSEISLAAQSAPGFDAFSGLMRTAGSLQLTIGNAHPPFDVLAIDSESFQIVAHFRQDFTSTSTDSLLNPLIREDTMDLPAYTLPGYPGRIGMWLLLPFQGELYVDQLSRNTSVTLDDFSLVVKCVTAQGEIMTLQFPPVDSTVPSKNGWQYFEGSLPALHDSSYPVSLLSFWFRHRTGSTYYSSVFPQLAVDGLEIVDRRTGEASIVNLFEAGGPEWSTTTPGIELFMDDTYPRAGGSRLVLDFGLSGLDMTDWIGVNLGDGTMNIKEDGPSTGDPGGSESQNRTEYPLLLPDHPSQLGLWVVARVMGHFEVGPDVFRAVGDLTTVDLEVRLRTQQGKSYSFPLQSMGEMPQEGYIQDRWQYFRTDLPDFSDDQYPLTLESFGLRVREDAFLPILVMDNLTVLDKGSGEELVIDEFEGLNPPYWSLEPSQGIGYTAIDTKGRSGSGLFLIFNGYGDLGKFGWLTIYPTDRQPHSPEVEAILANPQVNENDGQPPILPVLASPAFLDITQSEIGDRVGAWINSKPFILEIFDVVQYFPTMLEEKDGGFIITSRNAILTELNENDSLPSNINELFVSLKQNAPSQEAARQIQRSVGDDLQMLDVETLRQMIKADPLALGLRSVTTLGYLLTAVLSLVGFGTYFYMSVRQRRKMYGVLRAIGMSSVQIYGSLLLEQVVLIFSGLALGTGLGVLLNQLTLPGLPLNLGGQPPVPPFLAETDWTGVIRIYFTLAIAFLLSLAMATISLGRTKLHQVLRVDEE